MVPLNCPECNIEFLRLQKQIKFNVKTNRCVHMYCSAKCQNLHKGNRINLECDGCGSQFERIKNQIGERNFCSSSCSARFNNMNKSHGTRRSKLEIFIEKELTKRIQFEIHYNRKDTIGSELDIYIPHLKLAFEINGVFHYRNIYGDEKLQAIQRMDTVKAKACEEKGITLNVIDVSDYTYFKEATAIQFVDRILMLVAGVELESTISGL